MAWVLLGIMVDPIKVNTRIFFGNTKTNEAEQVEDGDTLQRPC